MSDQRINKLLDNLTEARKLISVMQSKIDRQRDDNTRMRNRIDTLMLDNREIRKKFNKLRETQND
jgi:uncharacterized protein YigA (DUF484 family)